MLNFSEIIAMKHLSYGISKCGLPLERFKIKRNWTICSVQVQLIKYRKYFSEYNTIYKEGNLKN